MRPVAGTKDFLYVLGVSHLRVDNFPPVFVEVEFLFFICIL